MRDQKKISTISLVLIIQIVVMLILSIVITATISTTTRKSSIQNMETITSERAQIIESYVKEAESVLQYYSKSAQIRNVLLNPDDPEAVKAAQEYTEDYSKDIPNLEGIYVSQWDTVVLAHTNKGTVGMQTRTEEAAQEQLHNAMIGAGNGVYNAGMIISPASGNQIVSMYKAVYDDSGQHTIGLVGLGVYTKGLVDTLDNLQIKGVKDASYLMVSTSDRRYVFNPDSSLIGANTTNKEIQNVCQKLDGKDFYTQGSFEYTSKGKKYIAIYSYIPKYNWILILNDTKSEVYSLTNVMYFYMAIFGVALLGLIIVFNYINRKQEKANQKLASTIIKSNKTKESLYTAMFKDVLTEVGNRIAFSMDFEGKNPTPDEPFYFIMFNINGFSTVNTRYGNDVGDWLLVRTVDLLNQVFKGSKIYRTGSDEFIVAKQVKNKEVASTDIMEDATDAYRRLTSGQNTPMGKINFEFRASVAKKCGTINTSVITALKDMINQNRNATVGQITYSDLDS